MEPQTINLIFHSIFADIFDRISRVEVPTLNISTAMHVAKIFERDEFLYNLFTTFRATTFERVRMRILVSSPRHLMWISRAEKTRLVFQVNLGQSQIKLFSCPAELSALKILSRETSVGQKGALVLEKHLFLPRKWMQTVVNIIPQYLRNYECEKVCTGSQRTRNKYFSCSALW